MFDPEAFADLLLDTVDRALGPILTRIATLEARGGQKDDLGRVHLAL
jgi:hypothetical protein